MNIGCHVSIAGGVFNAPERGAALGAEVIQMFSRSPQGGKAPELTADVLTKWKEALKRHNIKNAYIHTPYYINYASSNNRIRYGTINIIREELERASALGVPYIMTHLGSAKDMERKEAIKKTAEGINKSLEGYKGTCKLLIENAAGAGAIIGDTFKEINDIIKLARSKHIAGVCLDTQHSFASGYDWRTKESFNATVRKIDKELGLENIKLMHVNDSKVEFGARRDRHEHIGDGYIGKKAFGYLVGLAEQYDIDMILETEHDKVKEDIAILKQFRDEYRKKAKK
ncbi:MAG: deoxyribonuclease IV [Patescibacteria group bacterium]|nr:MAG: deoxyribonuclease IV [Patescibacteria group bacterium]